jgi:hypothetical protein
MALAHEKHCTSQTLAGGNAEMRDRFRQVRRYTFPGVKTHAETEAGADHIGRSGIAPTGHGLRSILGYATAKEVAATKQIHRLGLGLRPRRGGLSQ